ncbi:MAG: hypothetical protein AAF490_16370 [Chloroflexota bacterium]
MAKHKDRVYSEALYQKVKDRLNNTAVSPPFPHLFTQEQKRLKELKKMKKFRFQLLHRWMVERFAPCKVADIGGGKGLLSWLLQQDGYQTTVIDPTYQTLPFKYKDIQQNKQIKLKPSDKVRFIAKSYTKELGEHFDLLVGMHAHGCNVAIMETAVATGCGFILFPCCVIDEPVCPNNGYEWIEAVADYANYLNLETHPFKLNFKGQNIGLFHIGNCELI